MASNAHYAEDWQMQCGEIKQRGAHLLKSEKWSDCSFVVGNHYAPVCIKAHKLILAMASPVFEAMFYGPIAEVNNSITIPDIHPDTFRKLMEYIYTDNIELQTINEACYLYYGAQKYMLTHLLTVCTMYLSCNITPAVVGQIYEFALMIDDKSLITECEQLIETETTAVLVDKGFDDISLDTMEKIFSMDTLNITNELVLLEAAERYAKRLSSDRFEKEMGATSMSEKSGTNNTKKDGVAEEHSLIKNVEEANKNEEKEAFEEDTEPATNTTSNIQNAELSDYNNCANNDVASLLGSTPSGFSFFFQKEMEPGTDTATNIQDSDHNYCVASASKKPKGIQNHMKKVIQQIRFLTLTPAQLATYPTLTMLLNESEILSLMMNIASTSTNWPMPEGFSVSRTKR